MSDLDNSGPRATALAVSAEREEHPWNRQRTEDSKSWSVFMLYRDAQPARRSIREIARVTDFTEEQVHEIAERHDWEERVRLWDNHLEKQYEIMKVRMLYEMRCRHRMVCLAMQDKGMEKLERMDDEGLEKMSTSEAVKLLTEGMKGERLLYGEPTDIMQMDHNTDQRDANVRKRIKQLDEQDKRDLAILIAKTRSGS